jgi:adenosylcobinamide-phosphate synthase
MAAGAGALNVELGGSALYGEQLHQRIKLGVAITEGGQVADARAIRLACELLNNSVGLWLAALIVLAAFLEAM